MDYINFLEALVSPEHKLGNTGLELALTWPIKYLPTTFPKVREREKIRSILKLGLEIKIKGTVQKYSIKFNNGFIVERPICVNYV